MSIIYRQATAADKAALDECLQRIVETERPMDACLKPGHIEYYNPIEFIQDKDSTLLVAEDNNVIIACGAAKIKQARPYYCYQHQLYLNMMYVHPDYRGQGINGEIISKLMAWGKSQGVENVVLTVYPDNPSAIRAYEKMGFETALYEMRYRPHTQG